MTLKYIWLACLIWIIFLIPTPVEAHLFGQPPFFVVNGKYADFYKVPSSSLPNFPLAQDSAPENYLINTPIHFEFDVSRLPAPPEIVKKTTFTWDYGDGQSAQGLSNDHTYTKPGVYVLVVNVNDGSTPEPQLLESIQLNILPSKDYQLPEAIIKVNGQTDSDPLNNSLKFNYNNELYFDGSGSTAKSSKIVSYQWDFGDGTGNNNSTISHTYPKNIVAQQFPLLRVKDENGFIGDSFIQLQNDPNAKDNFVKPTPQSASQSSSNNSIYYLIGVVAVVASVGFILIKRKRA